MTARIVINPGAGPVAHATREEAWANIGAFVADMDLAGINYSEDVRLDRDGRFGFVLVIDNLRCEILMPGVPLDGARFTGAAGQNIWDYPRLYVDGNSWVWCYAVSAARRAFGGDA